MYSVSYCAAVRGIEGCMIQVEADISDGLPSFSLVGFLSSEVKEARERVQIGMKNAGFHFPPKKITINLSPADIRKGGTGYDLAIAVSILAAFGHISQEFIKNIVFIGELSLEGKIMEVQGVLPMVYTAYENGMGCCVVPKGNLAEAGIVKGIRTIGVSGLGELADMLRAESFPAKKGRGDQCQKEIEELDFCDVKGQRMVRRAIEVAAAGMHNLLMIGPPGSGKTMLARRIPGIMPELAFEEQMELSKIYSVAGLLSKEQPIVTKRPFRNPHHTITQTALIGGGILPKPGEVSLASGGVLFLDELAEFKRQTIEVLRQPLEDGSVTVICVETLPLSYQDFEETDPGVENEPSAKIRERVAAAQALQNNRYQGEKFFHNARLTPSLIKKYCRLTPDAEIYLASAFEKMEFSARVYHKILKVGRTIADLAGEEQIEKEHIAEAVCYRAIDKKYWGN